MADEEDTSKEPRSEGVEEKIKVERQAGDQTEEEQQQNPQPQPPSKKPKIETPFQIVLLDQPPFLPASSLPGYRRTSARLHPGGTSRIMARNSKGRLQTGQQGPRTGQDTTALLYSAIDTGDPSVVEYLIQQDPSYVPTSLIIEQVVHRRNPKILEVILGAEWSSPEGKLGNEQEQGDILGWVIRVGDVGYLNDMLAIGVEPTHKFRNKFDHLELCFTPDNIRSRKAEKLAEALLNSKSFAEFDIKKSRVLQTLCAEKGMKPGEEYLLQSAIDYLISKGADINNGSVEVDNKETGDQDFRDVMTPLTVAVAQSNLVAVKHLLARSADSKKVDGNGQTALDVAKENSWANGIELLQDHENGLRGQVLDTEDEQPKQNDGVASSKPIVQAESDKIVEQLPERLKPKILAATKPTFEPANEPTIT